MNDITVIIALSVCAILVLGMCACLYLFLSLKKEFYALAKKVRYLEAEVKASLTPFESPSIKRDDNVAGRVPAAPRLDEGATLDETSRVEILKLHRQGKLPAEIALTLNVPRNEADLLVRINRLVSQPG
jgi:hypothetical protein